MSNPVWWGQLVRSTAISQSELMRDVIQDWVDELDDDVNTVRFVWAEGATIPTALSIQAIVAPILLDSLMEKIQPLLGDTEFMIFAEMAEGDVFDQAYVHYNLVSRYFIGHYSGDEIAKRAERMALNLHEDLQKALDSGDESP